MAPREQQPEPTQEQIEAVLAVLIVGGSFAGTAGAAASVLGLPYATVSAVLHMMGWRTTLPGSDRPGRIINRPILQYTRGRKSPIEIIKDANNLYRSAFLSMSSYRVETASDKPLQMQREKAYWRAHVDADARRSLMALRTDRAVMEHGTMLGWHAEMDDRTSSECRAAHGRNFLSYVPPLIGYPGAVHARCRCRPGAPFPGAKLVNESTTVQSTGPGFETAASF